MVLSLEVRQSFVVFALGVAYWYPLAMVSSSVAFGQKIVRRLGAQIGCPARTVGSSGAGQFVLENPAQTWTALDLNNLPTCQED